MFEGRLEEVELLVLVDDLLRQAVGVEGLALEREDGLRLDVAARRERARGRVALHDEDHAVLRTARPCRPGAAGSRAASCCGARPSSPAPGRGSGSPRAPFARARSPGFAEERVGRLGVLVEGDVEGLLDELADELLDRGALRGPSRPSRASSSSATRRRARSPGWRPRPRSTGARPRASMSRCRSCAACRRRPLGTPAGACRPSSCAGRSRTRSTPRRSAQPWVIAISMSSPSRWMIG